MHPVIFQIDLFGLLSEPWSLHTYGLLIAGGFLLAMVLAKKQAEREGEDPDRIVDLAFYVLVSGLVGSRIIFIFTKLDEYAKNPIEIVMFWRGGLVWYGGFIGAALFILYYTRRFHLNFFKFTDIMIPYTALAHAFGRLGCVAAGCCFGQPADLPWSIQFPVGSMAHHQQQADGLIGIGDPSLPVHPVQLYEAGFELLMFALLTLMRPYKRVHGQLLLTWMMIYPIFRSINEMYRGDKERGVYGWLSTSQYISIGVALAAVGLYVYIRKTKVPLPAPAR
ncbi:MAG: prolipoprotein diacylglyceryl transferase [Deltaproteobacteria bacterium]|nr:prolipoprotein diacylglyceryl transferase [Deltaproteobacteria bacterium]